jgi:hypothetical protein
MFEEAMVSKTVRGNTGSIPPNGLERSDRITHHRIQPSPQPSSSPF